MFNVSRSRIAKPRDPDKPYLMHVYDKAGNLVFWAGPLDIWERDKTIRLYRECGGSQRPE